MNNKSTPTLVLKVIIWACLAVILFSPLYVSSQLFFPFIVTKTIAFQISVEVMLLAYLLLCLADKNYRIHTNITVILMAVYLVILTIASAFSGNDFYHSFWSNNERGDGILMFLHLFLFSVVLTSFFRSVKEWLWLFDLFIVAVFCIALVALDQYLAMAFPGFWVEHVMASANGTRLAATIGNSGYVGGYMVFGVFMALFMALKRSNLWAKLWYTLVMVLGLFIAIQTMTRGAYVAIALGALIAAVYLMWFYYNNKYLKIALVAIIVLGSLFVAGIFTFKNSSFVRSQPVLTRIAFTSLSDSTSNNRLVTWGIGLKGFMEKPLLGWGQENFYQVFDKYYSTKNTEQWFDRCHNMICDRAVTGGILGLLSYLALLLLPFWAIWAYYRKEYKEKTNQQENIARRYLTPIIFTILIIAYIIQNMFIFEALVTYVPLIMVLSFVGLYSRGLDFKFWDNGKVKIGLAAGGAIFFIIGLPVFNLNPLYANLDFIKAYAPTSAVDLTNRVNAFEEVISRGTLGNQEYRRHYFNFYEQTMMNYLNQADERTAEQDQFMADFASKMEKQLQAQVKENPYSVSNYLILIRFFDISYFFDISRFDQALAVADYAVSLSPHRPQIHYETATTNYYYGNYYDSINEPLKAKEQFRIATLKFFNGAKENVNSALAFDQFAQFLATISTNPSADLSARALVEAPIGDYKISDLTAQMIGWLKQLPADEKPEDIAARNSKMKMILEWLVKTDPQNSDLKAQLNAFSAQ